MDLVLEKLSKRQKIVAIISVSLFLVVIALLIISIINNNKVNAPVINDVVSEPVVTPPAEEINDISTDTGVKVDYSKYPTYDFPSVLLSDVVGDTKIPNPPVQYDGQPRVYIECGKLNAKEFIFKSIKKACIARLISDGSVALLGDAGNDYIYYKGKTRDEKTETIVKDISTTGNKTYLIYEYDYNTQSANYIDRISLVVPKTLQVNDLIAFFKCVDKPTTPYSDESCYAVYGKEWYDSNEYYLQHKDNYFRAVNLP